MKTVSYGQKRDYKKIDILLDGEYKCSTTWARTCKIAIDKYKEANNLTYAKVTACYSDKNLPL